MGQTRKIISTDKAPAAIGTYSQAIRCGDTVYLSGQIPLDPETMELRDGSMEEQINQVFKNLSAVARAADGNLNKIAKLNIYLTDLSDFATVNRIMSEYFEQPYPARAAVEVSALPRGARIEADAVMVLD